MRRRGSQLASLLIILQSEGVLTFCKEEVLKSEALPPMKPSTRLAGTSPSEVDPASFCCIDLHKRQVSGKGKDHRIVLGKTEGANGLGGDGQDVHVAGASPSGWPAAAFHPQHGRWGFRAGGPPTSPHRASQNHC